MPDDQEMVYLAACAIYRNEARYLREWVEFHLLVGFERFYLYDNGSDDNHLEILQPYIADGTVVLEHWPISPGRHLAYERCLAKRRQEARWIAFFDIDEFLFSPLGRPVPEIVGEFEQYPGIGANLLPFGTSGHKTEPDGLVIENFVRRSRDEKTQPTIKSIVNPVRAIHCWGAHSFLYFGWSEEYEGLTFEEPVWALVLPVSERREQIPLRTHDRSPELSYSLLRVNHYDTKSEEAFREKCGRADTGALDIMNGQHDDTIQMYVPSLHEAIRERESR
jgi:glycosyltransferase involved in cell wall biosynthesis